MSINRVILVMPPQFGLLAGFATGLLSLRAYLRSNAPELEVSIVDLSNEAIDLVDSTLANCGDGIDGNILFGLTTTTATYQSALAAARTIRSLFGSRAVIVLGGPHASADAPVIVEQHVGLIDAVVRGEGERSLLELTRSWPDLAGASGLSYVAGGEYRSTPDPALLSAAELDALELDESWFVDHLHPGKFDHFTYVSARGCPLKCKFCSVANQAIRAKSPGVMVKDLRLILGHGYTRIAIEDNFFAHSPRRTREVCDVLVELRRERNNFSWDCQTRVEAAARVGAADMLSSAGCDAVYLGVEALSADALVFLGKTTDPLRYLDMLERLATPNLLRAGLKAFVNVQFGLPEQAGDYLPETLAGARRLAEIARNHKSTLTIFPQLFVLYPGTPHTASYQASGLLWPTLFEDFTRWETDENELTRWMGRYFAHGVGGVPLGILDLESLAARRFRVDAAKLLRTQSCMDTIAQIPGLHVFSYEDHLAPIAPVMTAA
jgi:radical SAM superfamily enzyme YgiQ (UPF0313 family)